MSKKSRVRNGWKIWKVLSWFLSTPDKDEEKKDKEQNENNN